MSFWPKRNIPCPDVHSPSVDPEVQRDMLSSPKKRRGRKKENWMLGEHIHSSVRGGQVLNSGQGGKSLSISCGKKVYYEISRKVV